MCLVLDQSAFSAVFNKKDQNHCEFEPVENWIYNGPGYLVYGGTKYLKHLSKCYNYMKTFNELRKAAKAILIRRQEVDYHQSVVDNMLKRNCKCNDTHIIAIFRASGCWLFCTKDQKSEKYITCSKFYSSTHKVPKIYKRKSHKHLLRRCYYKIERIRNRIPH